MLTCDRCPAQQVSASLRFCAPKRREGRHLVSPFLPSPVNNTAPKASSLLLLLCRRCLSYLAPFIPTKGEGRKGRNFSPLLLPLQRRVKLQTRSLIFDSPPVSVPRTRRKQLKPEGKGGRGNNLRAQHKNFSPPLRYHP